LHCAGTMTSRASGRCISNDLPEPLPYPPTRLPALGLALSLLVAVALAGCGDDDASDGAPAASSASSAATGSGGDDANTPPSANGATEIVLEGAIPEGASIEATVTLVDAEGDAITSEISFEPFVEGALEGDQLSLRAGYRAEADLPGAAETLGTIVARDGRGAEATIAVRGTVAPLRWSDATEWTADGPEAREHGTVLVDDASGSIYVMFGSGYSPYLEPLGDAWRFDVATKAWSEVTLDGDVPPPGGSKRIGGVHGSGEGWIYGGYGEGNEAYDGVYHVIADGDALHFEELEQESSPGGRLLHVFGYDPGTETFAMFGGASTTLEGDTWTMTIDDGVATWEQIYRPVGDGPTPSARFGAFFGMDQELGRLVVFSGQVSFSNTFGDDTWVLDMRAAEKPTWTEVTPPEGPPGRRNGTSVFDPSASRFFIFGGTSDGATTQPGLFAFDARPGHEAWTLVEREGEPALRSSGFGAFAGGSVWMGFGNSASGVYEDFTRLGN
jgi:hypothetical protein